MFPDVERLCAYAWGVGRLTSYPRPSYELRARGTSPAELTLNDRIADGSMLRSFCRRQLGVRGQQVVAARHGKDPDDLYRLSIWLYADLHHPRLLLLDHSVRYWAEVRQHHSGVWWSKHLGRDAKTIWRWCRDPDGRSGLALLNDWLQRAYYQIEPAAKEQGLVP